MNIRRIVITGSLLASLFLINVNNSGALAETATEPSQQTSTEESTPTTTAADKAALVKRLEDRKVTVKVNLQKAEQARFQGRCKAAQVKVKVLDSQLLQRTAKHTAHLTSLTSHLNQLLTKLKAQNVDTTALVSQQTILAGKIAVYDTDLQLYNQAIKDLGTMDCTADVAGFKATLEAARAKQTTLKNDFKDITTYVQQTIKPALVEIRAKLASQTNQET